MGRTPVIDPKPIVPVAGQDKHGLDALPPGEVVIVVKHDDGEIVITRELDGATWDGTVFVTPPPSLNRYGVMVEVDAIDDPSAQAIVRDALIAARVEMTIRPVSEMIAEGVGR